MSLSPARKDHWRRIYGPDVQIVDVVSFVAEVADRPRVLAAVRRDCYAWSTPETALEMLDRPAEGRGSPQSSSGYVLVGSLELTGGLGIPAASISASLGTLGVMRSRSGRARSLCPATARRSPRSRFRPSKRRGPHYLASLNIVKQVDRRS
jgi:hypothetical protein